jgi:hypothetical protein
LNLEKVTKGGGSFDYLTTMSLDFMCFWGLFTRDLASKFVCSRANGVIIFQGLKSGVTM